jgi:hypothetical protein
MAAEDESFRKQVEEVAFMVHAAEDRKDDREFLTKVHIAVEEIGQRYQALEITLSEMDRMKLDRNFGRKVRDLRRLATLLPRIGTISASTPDRRAGVSEVGERMITGVSWRHSGAVITARKGATVGDDIDAWCGVCKESTTHSIVAMVDADPKQVVCGVCKARHTYRTGPARAPAAEAAKNTMASHDRAITQRAEERDRVEKAKKQAANDAIYAATDVIDFDPKRRYKVGEVLHHPDHGRGKIETVLRSSLLVRFAGSGLKSVMLM